MTPNETIDRSIEKLHQIRNVQEEDRAFLLIVHGGKKLSYAIQGAREQLAVTLAMAAHEDEDFHKVFARAAEILTDVLPPE